MSPEDKERLNDSAVNYFNLRCRNLLGSEKYLELQYENGKFVKGVTRGNGIIGDDITANVLKMKGLVKELKIKTDELSLFGEEVLPFTGGIRGEVIMSHEVHQKYFSDKANCRNAANGLMKRKDGPHRHRRGPAALRAVFGRRFSSL